MSIVHRSRPPRPGRAAVVACLLAVSGCAYSTNVALMPSHIKTVAIPVFENATPEYVLEQQMTDAVISRFVNDNHLKIVDERSANMVIRGTILGYRNAVFGFNSAVNAEEYRVTIAVSVVVKDQVKNRELWNDPNLTRFSNYYVVSVPGDTAKTELDGRRAAIDKIAEEILARTVEGW